MFIVSQVANRTIEEVLVLISFSSTETPEKLVVELFIDVLFVSYYIVYSIPCYSFLFASLIVPLGFVLMHTPTNISGYK